LLLLLLSYYFSFSSPFSPSYFCFAIFCSASCSPYLSSLGGFWNKEATKRLKLLLLVMNLLLLQQQLLLYLL
jgi:hypothetical protein